MKTNINEQSATWRAAFAEGLARGEAAFGEDSANALAFAEPYAYLVEAEQLKAAAETPADTAKSDAKASWAKAFDRLG